MMNLKNLKIITAFAVLSQGRTARATRFDDIVAAGTKDGVFGAVANSNGGDREVTLKFASVADSITTCGKTVNRTAVDITVDPTVPGAVVTTDSTRGVPIVSWPCSAGEEFVLVIFDRAEGVQQAAGATADGMSGFVHGIEDAITCGADLVARMAEDGVFKEHGEISEEGGSGTPTVDEAYEAYHSPGNFVPFPNTFNWLVYL
jgi:hypothetical protein